ncbi:outer membrane efflux protein [Hymenobacter roseosalivarius DSM 11622]|uniref:Outer membrane efflux protein n=1 Tax=Hymenobacter roseosalivarius DSM 11622 TaxID=645990 RepID=A0A1W1W0R5_9BACT|nr:TolC family protein [Hymenobacter roseosalivarius]SMB99219.1 outer membrane efflux protein [Hymenobacter roseosalivarius DSM 11622]
MKPTRTPLFCRVAAIGVGSWLLLAAPVLAQTARPAQPPAGTMAAPVPSGPWTLQRTVDYAIQNNLTVRQSDLAAQLNEATLRQSRAAMLPSANLSGNQAWNYGTSVNPLTFEFQNQTTRSNNFSGNSQITVFSGFQLRNTVKRNLLDYQASLADIEQARNDLSLNVAAAFLQLVLNQELVRTNELRANTTQQQVERTKKLLAAGSVAESNLLDTQAQLASDELNLVTAQNQRDISRLQLAILLNLDPNGAAALQIETPELPDPDEQQQLSLDPVNVYQTAQGFLPQVKAADLRVQSSIRGVDLARGAYYPRLFFGASIFSGFSSARLSRVLTGDSTAGLPLPVFQFNPATGQVQPTNFAVLTPRQPNFDVLASSFGDQVKDNLGRALQFTLQIPILNGLQARTNVQRSQIAVKQAELQAAQTRLQLQQTIQQAYADALAAQRRFASASRQVQALTTAYRNAEIRFNNGLLNGTEFNIAKNNLNGAESSMIQAKYEFIFRRKVLEFYQGNPLTL